MVAASRILTPPLCVDLDGTLIRSDLLLESLLRLIKRNPLLLFAALLWALRGRAVLKAEVAARVNLDPAGLPYNQELLAWLKDERRAGREVWLCSAANEKPAAAVAAHLGVFDGVIASDSRANLAGIRKAQRLVERFGERQFDYCGNERRDLEIWRHSRGAILVNGGAALARRVASHSPLLQSFPSQGRPLAAVWRALRPYQWAKNVLVFVPLLAAHRATDLAALLPALGAFVALCLCASSVYLLNDMLDLDADRAHPRKAGRPFASGSLSLGTGFALFPALLAAGALLAAFLPLKFQIALACYYCLTCGYSLVLKRFLLIDAVALAGLYTLRIIAGAGASGVALSFWLLLFSVFLFLSLAFVKRYAELDALRRQQRLQALGRGYRVEDLAVLQSFGTAAGYLSVLVLALYINSPDIQPLYHRPKAIWMLCVLMLYWISRVWMTAHRGGMHDDPVVYALRDRVSLGIGVLAAITVALAV
jgi:4-hydroxybenzoate polyprenyltransferase/phosphoserine phosphatase